MHPAKASSNEQRMKTGAIAAADSNNNDANNNSNNKSHTMTTTSNPGCSVNEKIENIYKEIGEFGRYQLLIFVLVGIISFVPAIVGYSFGFYAATPNHRYTNLVRLFAPRFESFFFN